VPLSEHEQRQLEQIEQALYAEHPRFARAVRAADPRVHYRRRLIQATLGFLIGVGLLVAGVLTKDPWIGAGGFVVLLACSMWALSSYRHMSGITSGRGLARDQRRRPSRSARPARADRRSGRQSRPTKAASSGMMERIEERWRRRQERDR
jgi:DUF3040 family protein